MENSVFLTVPSEKTPVKWQILEEKDTDGDGAVDDLFLLADQVLDAKAYNTNGVEKTDSDGDTDYSCTWETSTLRTWMNGEFYDALFTDEEKKAVKETEVKNEDNPDYGTAGENDTKDHLFLLSLSDTINTGYGFSAHRDYYDQARMAKTTAYAKENGTDNSVDGTAWWWLRSPGSISSNATDVDIYGNVDLVGDNVNSSSGGVRSALHLNLSSTVWEKGSEVTSDDEKTETTDSLPGREDGKETTKPGIQGANQSVCSVLRCV